MQKYIIGGFFVILGVIGAAQLAAYAQSAVFSSGSGSSPVIVTINPNGSVLMRGVVESVGTDTVTIKSWGGVWTVKIDAATEIISPKNTLSDFKVGDIAGVRGEMAHDASFTIGASIIRAWGTRADHDKDGIPDDQDSDDDNDRKPDTSDEKLFDHDNDGIQDNDDKDDDNDLIEDDTDTDDASDIDDADTEDSDDASGTDDNNSTADETDDSEDTASAVSSDSDDDGDGASDTDNGSSNSGSNSGNNNEDDE